MSYLVESLMKFEVCIQLTWIHLKLCLQAPPEACTQKKKKLEDNNFDACYEPEIFNNQTKLKVCVNFDNSFR